MLKLHVTAPALSPFSELTTLAAVALFTQASRLYQNDHGVNKVYYLGNKGLRKKLIN